MVTLISLDTLLESTEPIMSIKVIVLGIDDIACFDTFDAYCNCRMYILQRCIHITTHSTVHNM